MHQYQEVQYQEKELIDANTTRATFTSSPLFFIVFHYYHHSKAVDIPYCLLTYCLLPL
jgi:hypothetical protein